MDMPCAKVPWASAIEFKSRSIFYDFITSGIAPHGVITPRYGQGKYDAITFYFDYCPIIWMFANKTNIEKLDKKQIGEIGKCHPTCLAGEALCHGGWQYLS